MQFVFSGIFYNPARVKDMIEKALQNDSLSEREFVEIEFINAEFTTFTQSASV